MPAPLRRLVPLAVAASLAAAALASTPALAAPDVSAKALGPFVLEEATIADVRSALLAGRTSCSAIVDTYLARIGAYDDAGPAINSLIAVADDARAQAAALDARYAAGGPVGSLHCIPMVLKDNIDTKDMATTAGSKTLAGSVPTRDATITERLRAAGALVLAKGNLDEWAHGGMAGYSSVNGQTKNPYDLTRSPAGSSGGPAAAVAANLAMAGVGSDTLGSLRGPIDAESLAGVKPTLGLISGAGVVPFSLTFDVAGPLTRSVADSAEILNVIAGVDPDDARTAAARGKVAADYRAGLTPHALQGVRIGLLRNLVTGGNTAVFDQALATMRRLGAEIVELQAPAAIGQLSTDYYTIISQTEFKTQLGEYLASRRPGAAVTSHADVLAASSQPGFGMAPAVLARLQAEARRGTLNEPEYVKAVQTGPQAMRDVVDGLLANNDVDVLLHPASTASAMASLSGYPAALVPGGTNAAGISVGLALQGAAFTEPRLLGYAYAFEQAAQARTTPALTPRLASTPSATPTVTATPSATPTATTTCGTKPVLTLSSTTMSATGATGVSVSGAPGSTVDLLAYTRPSTSYQVVRSGTVAADGTLAFPALAPPANTRLYARTRGCPANPADDSQVLHVRTTLTLTASRLGAKSYEFSGAALPARPGGLVVSLYRIAADGRQVLAAQTRASATTGGWTIRRTFTGSGRYGFVVRTGQDLQNAAGASNVRSTLVF
ncbi:MAG: hypothetical protein JWN57_1453 [Frankiales bacterium]|nr:hypothetical protein [Frankiales bacterium]